MKTEKTCLKIVVCVKQVPDTQNISGNAMRDDGTVNRAALPAIFNPEDRNALELALRVRDENGGSVAVVTMGLPSACGILREALMAGADEACLITDKRAAASDTLATSYILSCAIRRFSPDLVFTGRQAIDGDTAQTGPQIAEKLGYTLLSYVEELSIKDGFVYCRRDIGSGSERDKTHLPVLCTVSGKAPELRPAHVRRIMKYKNARASVEMPDGDCEQLRQKGLLIDQLTLDEIGADPCLCGKNGSPTRVHRIQSLSLSGGQYKEFAPTDSDVRELVSLLIKDHVIG